RFGQPAPTAIVKGGIPFIPDATGFVAELGAARQFKWHAAINAVQADLQRRACFNEVSDLAEVFELAVAARDDRIAVFADHHDGRADFELNRRAARRTGCLYRTHEFATSRAADELPAGTSTDWLIAGSSLS